MLSLRWRRNNFRGLSSSVGFRVHATRFNGAVASSGTENSKTALPEPAAPSGGSRKTFGSGATPFTLKTTFEESLQRLFRNTALRVDTSPVKRPLLEGSLSYEVGKMKITLVSGLYANSREEVEKKIHERAELLAKELHVGKLAVSDKDGVTKLIQTAVGKVLPQLLNHLDIQLHIRFNLAGDRSSRPSLVSSPSKEHKKFRCLIYTRDNWESQVQWELMASVSQAEIENACSSGSSLLEALRKASETVEAALEKKREDHYFESMREAKLLLQDLPQSPILSTLECASTLRVVDLRSSVLQSNRGTPLLLKVSVLDEKENETSCGIPLSGGNFVVMREKVHISINCQYSSIDADSDVNEIPLVPSSNTAENRATQSVLSLSALQSSVLPPPSRVIRHLSSLLPTVWYELSSMSFQPDLHNDDALGRSQWVRSAFSCAMAIHAGTPCHGEWSELYAKALQQNPPMIPDVFFSSATRAVEKMEDKMSFVVGWRDAPVLHAIRHASLLSFAVSSSTKQVFALGTVFESLDHLHKAISRSSTASGTKEGKYDASSDFGSTDGTDSFHSSSSIAQSCTMEIIAVEETLKALGVLPSGLFDPSSFTLELELRSNNDDKGQRKLIFSQLNEPSGIARLFRFCQKSAKIIQYQSVRMDVAGSTYCRRVQRLLALVFRTGQMNKPGLRGRLLPIPVPFTTKFLVLPFTSSLQREVFSKNLLMALEPFCKIPSDYPSFLWPAAKLPQPCFFNNWGPTKTLLQRLGPYYYCSVTSSLSDQQSTSSSENEKNAEDDASRSSDENRLCNQAAFTLHLFPGDSLVDAEPLAQLLPLTCKTASELPIAVLRELDSLVSQQQKVANSTLMKKSQEERLQKMLCDRGVPREITLSNPHIWPKVLRLIFDSQEYYVRHQNNYKLLLELTPSIKAAELASIEVFNAADDVWKNALATQYAEKHLLVFLETVSALCMRSIEVLQRIPIPPSTKQLKFFSINIRSDIKLRNFHGSLSAGSSSFRKDTIQGLPSSTPTAALEALLKEIDGTEESVLQDLSAKVYTEITSGMNNNSTVNSSNVSTTKLVSSLELSALQKTLSPYLEEVQAAVKLSMNLSQIIHKYDLSSGRLILLGRPSGPNEHHVEIASKECKWDDIPVILPCMYNTLLKDRKKKQKPKAELERALTKGAAAMLEHQVRSRIVPVMGTEKLFQNIRVVQVLVENMWYAELKLPAGLMKVDRVGEPPVDEGRISSSDAYQYFYIRSSTNTKKGALRKILSELYILYVQHDTNEDKKVSLCGGRAPSTPLLASVGGEKKVVIKTLSRPEKNSAALPTPPSPNSKKSSATFPSFMMTSAELPHSSAPPQTGAGFAKTPKTPKSAGPPVAPPQGSPCTGLPSRPQSALALSPSLPQAKRVQRSRHLSEQLVPRKTSGARRAALRATATTPEESRLVTGKRYKNFYSSLLSHVEQGLAQSSGVQGRCTLSFSRSLGIRLFWSPEKDGGHTDRLIYQSPWSPQNWPPFQVLQLLIGCLERESTLSRAERESILQTCCQQMEDPNTVLTPSMPAKQFCVFFFHRYFGWQACDAEDVAHLPPQRISDALLINECSAINEKGLNILEGTVKLAQLHRHTSSISFSKSLAKSTAQEDPDEAINGAWESCMMTIVNTFSFDQRTNIYQFRSLDEAVVRSLK